jgi:hypothetical protein
MGKPTAELPGATVQLPVWSFKLGAQCLPPALKHNGKAGAVACAKWLAKTFSPGVDAPLCRLAVSKTVSTVTGRFSNRTKVPAHSHWLTVLSR